MNVVQGLGFVSQSVVHKPRASNSPGGSGGSKNAESGPSFPDLEIILKGWAQNLAYYKFSGNSAP